MNLGVNSMSLTTSNASRKSGDEVPGQFPAGLRVLVVDDDPTCLRILEKMLRNCHYEVTKCSRAVVALKSLRENRDGFDIVISDVHMPDMDGFKLLEHVGLEMDLPVIMMSADDSKHVVMKGVTHGACDYLIKPVRMEALKNIWQHVVRKKRHEWKEKDLEQSGSVEDGERQQKPYDDAEYSSSANEGNWKSSKRRKDEEDEGEDKDDPSTLKKPRVVWSVELHQQFVSAVNQLGIDKAVPKKILELMNVPGLTRENVASHLQKYRLYLRRLSGQPQNGIVNSFMGPQDSGFGPLSGLDHLQALGQIPSQSLATIQAAAVSRKSFAEQRNIFSFENPHIRFAEGQQQQHNNGKQVNLLHGIPTTMDSKQLAALHQSLQPFGNVHSHSGKTNSPLTQQSRTRMLNEVGSTSVLNLPSTVGQAIPGAVFSPYQIDNARAPTYTSLSSPSSVVTMDFPRDTIPLASNSELNSSGCRSFVPNFDVFNDLNQNRTEDWGIGSTPQQSVLVQPAGLTSVTVNTATAFSATSGFGSTTSSNAAADHNSLRIKEERLPEMGLQDTLFGDHDFSQEDLIMTALFKQQQQLEGVENEFALDEYQLDNLPV